MDALQPDDPVNVGAYRLVGKIGAGGMGKVYLGISPGGRRVAVKLVQAGYARDREFRERFAREVEAARRVGGFHTAQVVDADPLADPPWMVTAFIEGQSLQVAVTACGPLGPGEVRELGAGLAEGLAAIHACGLIHRDVKPSNVILGQDGPRIIDFGIARVAGTSKVTASGTVLGTLAYMSPEQVKAEPVGPASDVFSLACTLVFATAGHSPFDGETTAAVLYRIANEAPDLTRLPGDAAFRELITQCLAKNPADRPSLAEVMTRLSGAGEQHRPFPSSASASVPGSSPDTATARASPPAQGPPTVAAGASGSPAAAAVRTLPRDIASFTGRERQLQELMDAAPAAGGVVGIHAIGGMAGIGKTAFAVHAAHMLTDRFPAGQVFLPLHGHTPGQQPADPADALATLLAILGVPAGQIPSGLEARMALWRDQLAGRQLLLVLDDAASSAQVRPLLPGAAGSLVLVTSRRHLTALDEATAVSLDTLPPGEAAALLARLAGRPGLSADDAAAGEITRLCGYLPLAIGMVARQLHHHPAWSTAGRAAELADAVNRLELMAAENLSVAAAFDLSYADLSADQQRLFRRIGLHPGSELDAYAAAALDGTSLAAARRGLEALYDQYLLTEPSQGRYRMHDLIREHARALAARLDPDDERDQATARLLDYYQHAAAVADALIARRTRPAVTTGDEVAAAAVPGLADQEQALAWARAERASLLACLDYATATGQHARVIALTTGLAGLLHLDGPWADAITRHEAAVQAARQLADRPGQAGALHELGNVRRRTGDYPAAARSQEQALDIYRDLGDQRGEAGVLHVLGVMRLATGDYPAAAQFLERVLDIYRDLGDRSGQAHALSRLSGLRMETGDHPAATQAAQQALDIYRDLGDRLGQAESLSYLAAVRMTTDDYPEVIQAADEALGIFRDLGDAFGQARSLSQLGAVRRMMGDHLAAGPLLDQGLSLWRDLGVVAGQVQVFNEKGALYRATGDLAQAAEAHQQALELARAIVSAHDEAIALAGLGYCARDADDTRQAEVLLRQATEIFQRIGAAEAPELLAELDALAGPPPAP